jgi:hypothetical protein
MVDDSEKLEDFERQDTKTKLPLGWVILYVGLILWGIFYALSYTPQISGWTQEGQYQESLKQ